MPNFLPLKDLLGVTSVARNTLKADRHRGTSVAAFGLSRPILDQRCLLLDGMALSIHNAISGTIDRRSAAIVVRVFFDLWAHGLSLVEHRGEPFILAVGEGEPGSWFTNLVHVDALPELVRRESPLRKFLTINLALHRDEIIGRAAQRRIELGWFTLPPDDQRWLTWMGEHAEWRSKLSARFEPMHLKPPPAASADLPPPAASADLARSIEDAMSGSLH